VGTEEEQNKEERKGFAGLSALLSDVDTVLPVPAKQETARSAAPTGAEGRAESQQPEPQTKQQTYQTPARPSSGSSPGRWGLGIAAVVIGVLWLIGEADKSPSSPAPSYTPPARNTTPSYSAAPTQPQVPSRPDEAKPPVGQNLVFSTAQIRYCLAEDIRMDAAKAVLNNYRDSDVDRFNSMVADYNSRCGSYRYRNGALEGARRDIELYRDHLQAEGKSRFAHSPSKGSLSAPAPATGQWQQPQAQSTPSDADLEKQHRDFIHSKVPDASQLIADPRLLPWVNKSPMRQRYYEEGTAYEVVQLLTDFKLHLASLPQHAPDTAPARPAADETARAVQQKLNELGYNAGTADGLIGPSTRSAINAFQRDNGLVVDGKASAALLQVLSTTRRSASGGVSYPSAAEVPPTYRQSATVSSPPSASRSSSGGLPQNARLNYLGNDWECNKGYFKYGNECRVVQIPQNGKLTYLGNDWECNKGYFKYGNECRVVKTPRNGKLTYLGNDWECNKGYFKYGNECRDVQIPQNGKLTYLGNDWECNKGYFKYGNECRVVQIPQNGKLTYLGNNWECNKGYFKYGKECRVVQIPQNGKLTYLGNDWECEKGYRKSVDRCVPVFQ